LTVLDALHNAMRLRLTSTQLVTDLVGAANILDRNSLPAPDPSIVMGEHQELPGEDIDRTQFEIVSTIHAWKKEPSLAGVRAIALAIRIALQSSPLVLAAGYHCGDCHVTDIRALRDPDGKTSHAVITVTSIVAELS
jgi:hypothetical protein